MIIPPPSERACGFDPRWESSILSGGSIPTPAELVLRLRASGGTGSTPPVGAMKGEKYIKSAVGVVAYAAFSSSVLGFESDWPEPLASTSFPEEALNNASIGVTGSYSPSETPTWEQG